MEALTQLGRYRLTRVIGRGAMGIVYEGIDPRLNRPIAVKTILKSQLVDPELAADYSARFEREAQAVARLNHPHIVGVFDFGEENNVAYIVMELIRGAELKTHFDAKKLFTAADAVRMTAELLDALHYAHDNGIVHRDVKPANVMLDGQGRVKLTDFGVARLTDANSTDRTQAGTMVGTPSYMSPEQILGNPVGPRSDIFAAGIILYQLLTQQRPFVGDGHWAVQKQIVQDHPPAPSTLKPELDPAFDAVLYRALAKNPDQRYSTARAFQDDLKRALAGQPPEDAEATRLVLKSVREGSATVGAAALDNLALQRTGSGQDTTAIELEFWRSIKDSGDPQEFELYLAKFPNGSYADLARRKLSKLGEAKPRPTAIDDGATVLAPVRTSKDQTAAGTAVLGRTSVWQGKLAVLAASLFAAIGVAVVVGMQWRNGAQPASSAKSVTPFASPSIPLVTAASAPLSDERKPALSTTPAAVSVIEPTVAQPAIAPPLIEAMMTPPPAEPVAIKPSEPLAKSAAIATDERDKKLSLADKKKIEAERAKPPLNVAAVNVAKPLAAPAIAAPLATIDKKPVSEPVKAESEPAKKKDDEPAASAKPEDTRAADPQKLASINTDAMTDARRFEAEGRIRDAVRAYKRAATAGNGQAAKRLGDIYGNGAGDVARDYAESVRWYNTARANGVDVPIAGRR